LSLERFVSPHRGSKLGFGVRRTPGLPLGEAADYRSRMFGQLDSPQKVCDYALFHALFHLGRSYEPLRGQGRR
jgi:hypothetical protein